MNEGRQQEHHNQEPLTQQEQHAISFFEWKIKAIEELSQQGHSGDVYSAAYWEGQIAESRRKIGQIRSGSPEIQHMIPQWAETHRQFLEFIARIR
ncbi:hypothetical protein KA082_02880 [Candidatus Woesebacteria bacterium]|nr:hypothetical protein [Candidatus Woesebacteria bacterium]